MQDKKHEKFWRSTSMSDLSENKLWNLPIIYQKENQWFIACMVYANKLIFLKKMQNTW